jgi:hypothetical protein
METRSHKIVIEPLNKNTIDWFVNVAAVRMLEDEVKDSRLINHESLTKLAKLGMKDSTAFIAKCDDECVGAIGGLLLPNLFNPDLKSLTEIFWYVLPEFRRTRAGYLLLKAFDAKGKEVADFINMCLLFDSPVSIESLEKRGYILKEFSFSKDNMNGCR